MNSLESGGYRHDRPKLDRNDPVGVFHFAVQRYDEIYALREDSHFYLKDEIENFPDELNMLADGLYETAPILVVTTPDVVQREHTLRPDGSIGLMTLPFDHDASSSTHVITGKFRGFHIGVNNDIRMYIERDKADAQPVKLPFGVLLPYLSVGLKDAEIKLLSQAARERKAIITDALAVEMLKRPQYICQQITRIIDELQLPNLSKVELLQRCDPLFMDLSESLIEADELKAMVLEYIGATLLLLEPHTIESRLHQVRIGKYVKGYKQQGAARFEGVASELITMGSGHHKSLGVQFVYEDEDIKVATKHLTMVQKIE